MNRVILGTVLAIVAFASVQCQAAAVYFRGAMVSNIGGDTLGIMALPTQQFESLVTTNGAGGVIGNYIVFLGKSFNFSTGTFGAVGPNNGFTNLVLTDDYGNAAGTLTITLPGPVVPDTQAGFNSLIGRPGGIATITFNGGTYIGGILAVPEPSSMLALTGLVLGCGAFARRRRA